MTKTEQELAELEHEMGQLCARRSEQMAVAEAMVKAANKDFDRAALPLARKIARLRWANAQQASIETSTQPAHRQLDTGTHDPEWSQQDIDHYHELKRRASNGR